MSPVGNRSSGGGLRGGQGRAPVDLQVPEGRRLGVCDPRAHILPLWENVTGNLTSSSTDSEHRSASRTRRAGGMPQGTWGQRVCSSQSHAVLLRDLRNGFKQFLSDVYTVLFTLSCVACST